MLLIVLALSGAILGATTVAGMLMVYQLNATTDSKNSASAIFAADSGVEWAYFDHFCGVTSTADLTGRCAGPSREQALPGTPPGTFSNGAEVDVTCYDANAATTTCSDPAASYAVSKGNSQNSARAFLLNFEGSTSTLP